MAKRKMIFRDISAESLKDENYVKEALDLLKKFTGNEVAENFEKDFFQGK